MNHPKDGLRTDPVDPVQFRRALKALLVAACENDLEVSNQCWTCDAGSTHGIWDVEITTVDPGRDTD